MVFVCLLYAELGRRAMASTKPNHLLCPPPGAKTVPNPSELQDWQNRPVLWVAPEKLEHWTLINSLPPKGEAKSYFFICLLCAEPEAAIMVSTSPNHHIHSPLGI